MKITIIEAFIACSLVGLFVLGLFSCCDGGNKTYVVHDGTRCARSLRENCGMSLYACDNGKEYKCAQNVSFERRSNK